MAAKKRLVTIKGIKDGLIFQLHDDCEFDTMLQELEEKLSGSHHKFLEGSKVQVQVQLGSRHPTNRQIERLKALIGKHDNLEIQSFESDVVPKSRLDDDTGRLTMIRAIVRSGQTVHHDGDLLLLGDVNAGGTITSTGDIYVLGALRGMAHAGISGNEKAIVAASYMKPTQLRIAGVISRPPDEWGTGEATMEFAYLNQGMMEIDTIGHISRVRPDGSRIKGE